MTEKPIIALLYDFDKTLCTTDMEDYTFIPALGYKPAEFWKKAIQGALILLAVISNVLIQRAMNRQNLRRRHI